MKSIQKFSEFQALQTEKGKSLYEADLQKEYGEIFTSLLKKYGVNSPADLNDKDKKEFFNTISDYYIAGKGATKKGEELINEAINSVTVFISPSSENMKYIKNAKSVFDDMFSNYGEILSMNSYSFNSEDSAYDFVSTLLKYAKIPKDEIESTDKEIIKLLSSI